MKRRGFTGIPGTSISSRRVKIAVNPCHPASPASASCSWTSSISQRATASKSFDVRESGIPRRSSSDDPPLTNSSGAPLSSVSMAANCATTTIATCRCNRPKTTPCRCAAWVSRSRSDRKFAGGDEYGWFTPTPPSRAPVGRWRVHRGRFAAQPPAHDAGCPRPQLAQPPREADRDQCPWPGSL